MTIKHLWLKLPPFWASMDPVRLSPAGWAALDPQVREAVSRRTWQVSGRSPELPPGSMALVPTWEDPPPPRCLNPSKFASFATFDVEMQAAEQAKYTAWPADLRAELEASCISWNFPLEALLRNAGVTLCGQLIDPGADGVAARHADATCVDCLHRLEVGGWLVHPFDHSYGTCRVGNGKLCRRCYAHDAPFRALVSK